MAKPYARLGWSALPIDLLIHIVRLLELPEALSFRAVCPLWRSASTAAAGAPRTRQAPWLVTLVTDTHPREKQSPRACDPSVSSNFRNLLDKKTYDVSFPRGTKAVAFCGASHGWLVVANELSDLVLYDPFAMTTIPLPPITGFSNRIEGVHGDDKNIKGYRYRGGDTVYDVVSPGMNFYDKVVLSGSPSAGGVVALAVHTGGGLLSFARVGDKSWRHVASLDERGGDCFADIVHHHGRFYTLTIKGRLVSLNFCSRKPKREMIIANDAYNSSVITRYLISTPWGDLLQVGVILDGDQKNGFRVKIDRLDFKGHKMVGLNPVEALQGHTVFLGQNSPGVLSTDKFPELRPDCIYFTTPRLKNETTYGNRYNRWSGVKVYDLKKQRLEGALPSRGENYGRASNPLELWFTPSQLPY